MPVINVFQAKWHPENHVGKIMIAKNPQEKKTYNFDDPAEFSAVLSLLATADNARIHNGWIEMGRSDIDGD